MFQAFIVASFESMSLRASFFNSRILRDESACSLRNCSISFCCSGLRNAFCFGSFFACSSVSLRLASSALLCSSVIWPRIFSLPRPRSCRFR